MRTLELNSSCFKIVEWVILIAIIGGTIYGVTLAGQQHPMAQTLFVAVNGVFWYFLYSATIGALAYLVICTIIHVLWCLFTHDNKYHWSIRSIVGIKKHFLMMQPK